MALSQILFQPQVNKTLAKFDDSKSMFSVAMRDGIDSSGRTLMEYKRNPHGGRERLLEEILTMLIWGFGINLVKTRLYDPLAKKFSPIKHPELDMDLLLDGPQKLDKSLLKRFAQKFPGTYDHLLEAAANPKLQQKYHVSNVAKFLIATGIPVLLIGFGIPTFNQWLTRKKISQETLAQTPTAPVPDPPTSFHKPAVFQALDQPPAASPAAARPAMAASGASPRFAGLGLSAAMGASRLLQNERYNTLLVDGVLSGGRIYKARNPVERMEILFREGSIVLFLYFAQGMIQKHIGGFIDKLTGGNHHLDFQAFKFLHERYGKDTAQFVREAQQGFASLEKAIPDLAKTLQQPKQWHTLEAPLSRAVRQYALQGAQDNVALEAAKASQLIPTLKNGALDLGQKINAQGLAEALQALQKLAQTMQSGQATALDRFVKKSMAGRFAAMILANGVCALFLSYICPKIQHWITYKQTGQDFFPGISAEG